MALVQVPLSGQPDRDYAQGDNEVVVFEMLLNLEESGKRDKVVRKSFATKKKLKSVVTKSFKSMASLSANKACSLKFYSVIVSLIYDTICNK